jgi:ABC-2 type transport system permease protein
VLARIYHMVIKELLQLRRDKHARFVLIAPPIIQLFIFGYAATFEVNRVSVALLDRDHTQESRELSSRFTATGRFQVKARPRDEKEVAQLIDRGDVTLALHIHPGFAELLRKGQTAPLQVILDGTNSNTALIALGYVNQIARKFAQDYQRDRIRRTNPALAQRVPKVELEQRPWYNRDLNSRWFFVPGVIGSLTLVSIVNLTAFAVVREREIGTLEQIMVTPIRPMEFILGKTLPFFLVGLFEVALVALIGTLWFQIPFRGSLWILLLGTALFLICTLGIGLLISTLCRTQQQAFASNFFVINPTFILSGFSFPISSMPEVLQWFTYLDPLRYYLVVLRSSFLKGVGIGVLWPQLLAMAMIGTVLLGLSMLRFRKSLD